MYFACTTYFPKMMGEETYAISGDNRKFDPFAKLSEIKSHLQPDARLVSIEATFVRSDGTMDLEAEYTPFPMATYTFHRPLEKPPENAPPIGAGRGPDDVWYEEIRVTCYRPGQLRSVSRTSGNVRTRYTYKHQGIDVDRGSPRSGRPEPGIEPPKCSTQEIWKLALSQKANPEAVARIEYDKDGYSFRIDRTDVAFECDADCRLK